MKRGSSTCSSRGQALYIDSDDEARRVLDTELAGTLLNRVSDLRATLTFDPAQVNAWRLLGDDSRDLKSPSGTAIRDGGSLGAGQQSIALYQLRLNDKALPGELLKWQLKFHDARQQERLLTRGWSPVAAALSHDWQRSAAVAILVQNLKDRKAPEAISLDTLPFADGELLELLRQAQKLQPEKRSEKRARKKARRTAGFLTQGNSLSPSGP